MYSKKKSSDRLQGNGSGHEPIYLLQVYRDREVLRTFSWE